MEISPFSSPEPNISTESKKDFGYVEINELPRDQKEYWSIKPKYKIASTLVLAKAKIEDNEGFTQPSLDNLFTLQRSPALEEAEIKEIDGDVLKPKEIADHNFREMERATALKWFYALNNLFQVPEVSKFPVHENGRVRITTPGCNLGFEIGGILDFFNAQGIPVDIDAIDIGEAGTERDFLRLDERTKSLHSTVSFYTDTDAAGFFSKGLKNDIIILRHPGPIWTTEEYKKWQDIVTAAVKTEPAAIILSTYNHEIDNPEIVDLVGFKEKKRPLTESDAFDYMIKEQGFQSNPNCYDSVVQSDLLEYPLSPYMVTFDNKDGKLQWTAPVDRWMEMYFRPDLTKTKD